MKRNLSSTQSGFTLIEILVSMSIGIVLIYLLSATLAVTQRGWVSASLLGQVTEQKNHTAKILRHVLTSMLPPAPDGREHMLIVSNNSIEFFTLPPQSRAEDGLMHARLAIEAEDRGLFLLVLNLVSVGVQLPTFDQSSRRVLLSGLASVRFTYYYKSLGTVSVGEAKNNVVPELIVVSWSYPDNATNVHELAVRPRMSLSGHCFLDLTSGTCRAS